MADATTQNDNDDRSAAKRQGQLQDAIAELVKELPRGTHLTAPEVYRRAKQQGLQVSLSTVYRTLNMMQAHGNVTALSGEHGRRYEARDSDHDHDHLICLKCGLTIEFTDELIRGFGKAVAERKGYEHRSSRFDVLGICYDCRAKDEDHKIANAITALENVAALAHDVASVAEQAVSQLETRKLARARELMSAALPQIKEAVDELNRAIQSTESRD